MNPWPVDVLPGGSVRETYESEGLALPSDAAWGHLSGEPLAIAAVAVRQLEIRGEGLPLRPGSRPVERHVVSGVNQSRESGVSRSADQIDLIRALLGLRPDPHKAKLLEEDIRALHPQIDGRPRRALPRSRWRRGESEPHRKLKLKCGHLRGSHLASHHDGVNSDLSASSAVAKGTDAHDQSTDGDQRQSRLHDGGHNGPRIPAPSEGQASHVRDSDTRSQSHPLHWEILRALAGS